MGGLRSSFLKFKESVLNSQSLGIRMETIEEKESECKSV